MLEVSVVELLVGVDLAVAEVADQQVAAKATEAGRGEREPPRCVELPVLRNPCKQVALKVVSVYEAASLAGDLVLFVLRPASRS